MPDESWKPDLYVVARILDALWRPEVRHTRGSLQRAARLNYDLYRRYLDFLAARGLVAVTPHEDGDRVALTPEGLRLHRQLGEWLAEFFGGA